MSSHLLLLPRFLPVPQTSFLLRFSLSKKSRRDLGPSSKPLSIHEKDERTEPEDESDAGENGGGVRGSEFEIHLGGEEREGTGLNHRWTGRERKVSASGRRNWDESGRKLTKDVSKETLRGLRTA